MPRETLKYKHRPEGLILHGKIINFLLQSLIKNRASRNKDWEEEF